MKGLFNLHFLDARHILLQLHVLYHLVYFLGLNALPDYVKHLAHPTLNIGILLNFRFKKQIQILLDLIGFPRVHLNVGLENLL